MVFSFTSHEEERSSSNTTPTIPVFDLPEEIVETIRDLTFEKELNYATKHFLLSSSKTRDCASKASGFTQTTHSSTSSTSMTYGDVGQGTSHCPASCKTEVKDKKENVEMAQECNSSNGPVDKDVHGTKLESNGKHTSEAYCQTIEAKRGKKTIDASNDVKMEGTGPLVRYTQGKEVKETSDDDDDAGSLWSSDDDEHFDPFEDDPTHLDARQSP
nr:hypothetical protein [Tanacetum cinerariifolium]